MNSLFWRLPPVQGRPYRWSCIVWFLFFNCNSSLTFIYIIYFVCLFRLSLSAKTTSWTSIDQTRLGGFSSSFSFQPTKSTREACFYAPMSEIRDALFQKLSRIFSGKSLIIVKCVAVLERKAWIEDRRWGQGLVTGQFASVALLVSASLFILNIFGNMDCWLEPNVTIFYIL